VLKLEKKGHAAGRGEKGRVGGSRRHAVGEDTGRNGGSWEECEDQTASASNSQRASAAEGPAAVVPTATEQRAAHETVGMQEYLRYARLR
jgi:hypothetical protein